MVALHVDVDRRSLGGKITINTVVRLVRETDESTDCTVCFTRTVVDNIRAQDTGHKYGSLVPNEIYDTSIF